MTDIINLNIDLLPEPRISEHVRNIYKESYIYYQMLKIYNGINKTYIVIQHLNQSEAIILGLWKMSAAPFIPYALSELLPQHSVNVSQPKFLGSSWCNMTQAMLDSYIYIQLTIFWSY